ncbi:MAG TPA: bifunctional DNA primase/polymerase, partial [Pyrinomonadaceae bacterium]
MIGNGYRIVPIPHGSKATDLPGWTKLHATAEDIDTWSKMIKYRNGNIGILTEATPCVDIDVYDKELADELEAWVLEKYGDAMVRVGRAPKRALIFRAERPFPKREFTFADGKQRHKVEVLATGQQFVAYGIHPDTRKPYTWTSFEEPLDTPASVLPLLSMQDAEDILDYFGT